MMQRPDLLIEILDMVVLSLLVVQLLSDGLYLSIVKRADQSQRVRIAIPAGLILKLFIPRQQSEHMGMLFQVILVNERASVTLYLDFPGKELSY